MKYDFSPKGVCARRLEFELDGDIVKNVRFMGGCNGNLKAIGKLTEGMDAERLVSLLSGNTCGGKGTSCADQLSRAVRLALKQAEG